jgi:hypothetical protein
MTIKGRHKTGGLFRILVVLWRLRKSKERENPKAKALIQNFSCFHGLERPFFPPGNHTQARAPVLPYNPHTAGGASTPASQNRACWGPWAVLHDSNSFILRSRASDELKSLHGVSPFGVFSNVKRCEQQPSSRVVLAPGFSNQWCYLMPERQLVDRDAGLEIYVDDL